KLDRELSDKIDKLNAKFSGQIDSLDDKIDKLDAKFSDKIDKLDEKVDKLTVELATCTTNLSNLDKRVEKIEGTKKNQIWNYTVRRLFNHHGF
ncbi:hypothetical protein, partial [Limnofasciculus baicalensis]